MLYANNYPIKYCDLFFLRIDCPFFPYYSILHFDVRNVGLEFHPQSLLLASAADDGWLCLWTKAKQVGQILEGARDGFSCLAWSQDGRQLAAGGQNGELIVWSESKRGKGFG